MRGITMFVSGRLNTNSPVLSIGPRAIPARLVYFEVCESRSCVLLTPSEAGESGDPLADPLNEGLQEARQDIDLGRMVGCKGNAIVVEALDNQQITANSFRGTAAMQRGLIPLASSLIGAALTNLPSAKSTLAEMHQRKFVHSEVGDSISAEEALQTFGYTRSGEAECASADITASRGNIWGQLQ